MRVLWVVILVIASTGAALAQAPNPKQAAIHARQGKAYFDAKQYGEAIVEFKKSYDLDPKSVTLFKIASAYYQKGDMEGAIDYYGRYLQADPDGPLAQQALEFTTIARKAIADAKAKADAEAKARAEAEAKAKAEAEAEQRRIAQEARVKQAEAFAQAGAWTSAGDEYRAAADVGDNPDLLITAAEAYAKQPDLEKARAAYQAYLAKVPLGGKSDAVRVKVAELTRVIETQIAQRTAAEARARAEADARAAAALREKERSTFELAASLAPGVKLRGDNPFALALRVEAALRLGRRVNLGVWAEYARLDTSGACGTEIPGPDPASEFDFGPRNQFTQCAYVMAGLQLFVHARPDSKLDPYFGVTPAFRAGWADYTTHFNGMTELNNKQLLGIVTGFRGGVTYHLSQRAHAWSIGGFVELAYQWIGDEETEDIAPTGVDSSYLYTLFIGGRSTVTF